MSCLENDKIWDAVVDKAIDDGLSYEELMAMDLEDAFDYLIGKKIKTKNPEL